MRHCRVPPQQIRLLPQVGGVRPRGITLRPEPKAESRERARNLQGDFSGSGSQTIRDVPVANFYPEKVLDAPPVPVPPVPVARVRPLDAPSVPVARARPIMRVETVRPVLPIRPPVVRPTVSVPVVRAPAPIVVRAPPVRVPLKHEVIPFVSTLRKPPPTVVAVPRPAPPPAVRRSIVPRSRRGPREQE